MANALYLKGLFRYILSPLIMHNVLGNCCTYDNEIHYLIMEFQKRKYWNSAGGQTHPKHVLVQTRMKKAQKNAKKNILQKL
jgi:hypothetical protein